jgi:hypothetical protein
MTELEKIFARYERGYTATRYGNKDMANKYMRDDFDYMIDKLKNHGVIGDVIKQRELLKSFCDYAGIDQLVNEDDLMVDIDNHIKHFNSL